MPIRLKAKKTSDRKYLPKKYRDWAYRKSINAALSAVATIEEILEQGKTAQHAIDVAKLSIETAEKLGPEKLFFKLDK